MPTVRTLSMALFSMFAISLSSAVTANVTTTITPTYRSVSEILSASPKSDWYRLDQHNLIYITLTNDAKMVMELNDTFAPEHAKQIRLLANQQYWDDLTVYRVQDNYVAQFGALDYETDILAKPLPKDAQKLPAEFSVPKDSIRLMALADKEPYSDQIGFVDGYPVAVKDDQAFLVHCYGMVGAARDDAPDSSNGTELYVMIGQPARHIDRQISVVGRVVHGIEHLSTLTRGKGAMGFYTDDQPAPMGIKSVRVGTSLPASEQMQFDALKTDSQSFVDIINARRHMQGAWFAAPLSGGMGICDTRQTIQLVKE